MVTSDDFTSAEVLYEDTLPAVRQSLQMPPEGPAHIPVVTGFLGRGAKTGELPHFAAAAVTAVLVHRATLQVIPCLTASPIRDTGLEGMVEAQPWQRSGRGSPEKPFCGA